MEIKKFSGRLCIWGDSITWGADDLEMGGWVNRLRLYLENKAGVDISVYNVGISGDTTENLVSRFEIECKAREPEAILFAIGINDSIYIYNKENTYVSLQKFKENIQQLINLSKRYTKKIGFIGLTKVDESKTMPIPWDTTKYYDNENVKKYDNELKTVAENNGLKYLYIFDLLNPKEFDDGLHPNAEGHERMFQYIKKFIYEKILT